MTTRVGIRAVATVVAVAATLSGCEPGPAEPSTVRRVSTVQPTTAVDGAEQQARGGALAAYDGYRRAYVVAAATSDYNHPDLARYTADPLLAQLRQDLRQKQRQGLITTGKPAWQSKITAVGVAARPFTATIEDCFDATSWHTVVKSTGKSAAVPGQPKRYLVTAEAVQFDDGRWLIRRSVAARDRPC